MAKKNRLKSAAVSCRSCGTVHDDAVIDDACWTAMTSDEKARLVGPRRTLELVRERDALVKQPTAEDIEAAAVAAAREQLAPAVDQVIERFELVGTRMPPPRRDPAWLGTQLDMFQAHLTEG